MKQQERLDKGHVVLIPDGPEGLGWSLSSAPEPGKICVALRLNTESLGQFVIPLGQEHFALLVAVGRELLDLPPEKVARLREELEDNERKAAEDE